MDGELGYSGFPFEHHRTVFAARGEEALHARVAPDVARPTHAARDARGLQVPSKVLFTILAVLIRMVQVGFARRRRVSLASAGISGPARETRPPDPPRTRGPIAGAASHCDIQIPPRLGHRDPTLADQPNCLHLELPTVLPLCSDVTPPSPTYLKDGVHRH